MTNEQIIREAIDRLRTEAFVHATTSTLPEDAASEAFVNDFIAVCDSWDSLVAERDEARHAARHEEQRHNGTIRELEEAKKLLREVAEMWTEEWSYVKGQALTDRIRTFLQENRVSR